MGEPRGPDPGAQPPPQTPGGDREGDARWRAVLSGDYASVAGLRSLRPLFEHLPSNPRCKLCAAPYGPPFGPVIRRLGFGPWDKNPSLCGTCLRLMERHLGGAEIELSLLFADLRGSTELAANMTNAAYRELVNAYYAVAAREIKASSGVINKYVGDGVFALFVPGFTGVEHAARAIEAARGLMRATQAAARPDTAVSALAVGVGVHTGPSYVGVMGQPGDLLDFTAIGDAVNVTQRLSAGAASRELLISDAAWQAAGRPGSGAVRRELQLKGVARPVTTWSEVYP